MGRSDVKGPCPPGDPSLLYFLSSTRRAAPSSRCSRDAVLHRHPEAMTPSELRLALLDPGLGLPLHSWFPGVLGSGCLLTECPTSCGRSPRREQCWTFRAKSSCAALTRRLTTCQAGAPGSQHPGADWCPPGSWLAQMLCQVGTAPEEAS